MSAGDCATIIERPRRVVSTRGVATGNEVQMRPDDTTRTIPLANGGEVFVDDDDYGYVSQWRWSSVRRGHTEYAVRSYKSRDSKSVTVYMHRELLGLQPGDGWDADHANGHGLDNRRANLRRVTRTQNTANQHKTRGTSRYRGVFRMRDCNRWCAQAHLQGKHYHCGLFVDEIDAAIAADLKLIELHGGYAKLNFLRAT